MSEFIDILLEYDNLIIGKLLIAPLYARISYRNFSTQNVFRNKDLSEDNNNNIQPEDIIDEIVTDNKDDSVNDLIEIDKNEKNFLLSMEDGIIFDDIPSNIESCIQIPEDEVKDFIELNDLVNMDNKKVEGVIKKDYYQYDEKDFKYSKKNSYG